MNPDWLNENIGLIGQRMKQRESLEPVPELELIDEVGQPLSSTLQATFRPLQERFRRKFRTIRDDAVIHNLFDRAAQRYARELAAGRMVERPEAFAWKILCNLGISELRRSEEIVANRSVASRPAEQTLLVASASAGGPEAIYARVYARQLYSQMSERERVCAVLKTVGYSSSGVAMALKMTPAGVDKMMQRLRDRIRSVATDSGKIRGRLGLLQPADPKSRGGN